MMLERKHTVGQIRTIQLSEQLKFVSKSFLSTQNWTLVLIQSTGQNGRYTCVSSVSNKEMVKIPAKSINLDNTLCTDKPRGSFLYL